MTLQEQIKSDFTKYIAQVNGERASAFVQLQEKAFNEFEQLGIPTIKHEEWKYTNLKALSTKDFQFGSPATSEVGRLLEGSILNGITANRLLFVNGQYQPSLSRVIEKDDSIVISTIAEAHKKHTSLFEQHFGKYAKLQGEALNAMNTALMSDGAFIYVPKNKSAEHPILITNIVDSTENSVLNQPRNLIIVEQSGSVKIIENYISTGNNASFTNVVNEVYAGENATVEHYKVQRQGGESYHNNHTQIFQEANTSVNQVTLTLDGALVRNNLHFYMNGQNCNSLLYGLFVTEKKNHVDNHTRVDHAMPNCFSDELYKGIMKDQSTGVFNGKIMVHHDAQKTNAYQRNQNILLSQEATINTKPQLEIFADDVKCTHGATIGQLDEEPMFYLRSRGIPEAEACKLLLNAFADEIAEMIKVPELVQILEEEIEKKL